MKTVRFRILLLLTTFSVVVIAGLTQWRFTEAHRLRSLSYQAASEAQNYVTKIVNLKSSSIVTLASDYTIWDDMATFVHTKDKKWAVVNLDQALSTYDADASYVFDNEMHPVYGSDPQLAALNVCP